MLVSTNIKDTWNGPTLNLTNNATMNATKTGILPLSRSLITYAEQTHIFDWLQCALLLSIGQLCGDDCISILDKIEIKNLKDKILIQNGHRNKTYRLWYIPISRLIIHRAHSIITRSKKEKLIQYPHGCFFHPRPIIFLKAIKNGNFFTWTGLNNEQFLNHLTPIIATAFGYMDQERKNLQLTKQVK